MPTVPDNSLEDCYRILELEPGASLAEVRAAYRVQSRVWHPDRFAHRSDMHARATARQQQLNDAYRSLLSHHRTCAEAEPAPERNRAQDEVQPRRQIPWSSPGGGATSEAIPEDQKPSRPRTRARWLGGITIVLIAATIFVSIWSSRNNDLVATDDGAPLLSAAIAAGGGHACAADTSSVYCWGRNDFGQAAPPTGLATGDVSASAGWRQLPEIVSKLAVGLLHSCALVRDGTVHCWGGNFTGQVGDGVEDRAEPTAVRLSSDIADLSSLGRHTCALGVDGSLACWGDDTDGQLGVGGPVAACTFATMRFFCSDRPVQIDMTSQWRAVAAGGSHTCAITGDGELYCWGSNRYGQIGGRTDESCSSPGADDLNAVPCARHPTLVESLVREVGASTAVAAGASHTCVLDETGRALCWGLNSQRQTGVDRREIVNLPTPVETDLQFTALVAGGYHTCGITEENSLYCWGSDASGELRGRADQRCGEGACAAQPVRVADRVTHVAAGFGITCASADDDRVRCWGRGSGDDSSRAMGVTDIGSSGLALFAQRMLRELRWRVRATSLFFDRNLLTPLRQVL